MLLQEGSTIDNKYYIERYLGEGAFAEVYRVKHKFLGRQALKIFKAPSVTLKEIERALGEAILLSKIGHPNIIRVYDAASIETSIGECGYFTMEYVAGGSLDSFWRSFGNRLMPVDLSVNIVLQVCNGLSVAHAENPPIIHRDIKPQNILVGHEYDVVRVRIGDFGLAKRVNPLTLIASAHGTIGFKPPEFITDTDSCAGDVWAIGTVLYLLLTDNMPFRLIESKSGVYEKTNWDEPLKPASIYNLDVDLELDGLVANALMYDSQLRYKNAIELYNALNSWLKKRDKDIVNIYIRNKNEASIKKETEEVNTDLKNSITKILEISQEPGRLNEALNQLIEIIDENPELEEQYGYLLSIWKRGIIM